MSLFGSFKSMVDTFSTNVVKSLSSLTGLAGLAELAGLAGLAGLANGLNVSGELVKKSYGLPSKSYSYGLLLALDDVERGDLGTIGTGVAGGGVVIIECVYLKV